jgi:hypothetical protein
MFFHPLGDWLSGIIGLFLALISVGLLLPDRWAIRLWKLIVSKIGPTSST